MVNINELKSGDEIELDNGFTCIDAGIVRVEKNDDGFYFYCEEGKHYLNGQCDKDRNLIGVIRKL